MEDFHSFFGHAVCTADEREKEKWRIIDSLNARPWLSRLFFCCCIPWPPIPSSIFNKMAFPRIEPTYTFEPKNANVDKKKVFLPTEGGPYKFKWTNPTVKKLCFDHVINNSAWRQIFVDSVDCYIIENQRTEKLACCHVKCVSETGKFVLLFCHPNGDDMGCEMDFYAYMSWRFTCDIFAFDYTGYGQSSKKRPTENLIYQNVEAAYKFLTEKLKILPSKIVIHGISIGTLPAMHLASTGAPVAGLILQALLMSGVSALWPKNRRKCFFDVFYSADKVPKIRCPVLVIHGANDEITDLENAAHFMGLCNTLVAPLIVPPGRHCSLTSYRAYWQRMEIFLCMELNLGEAAAPLRCFPECHEIHGDREWTGSQHMPLMVCDFNTEIYHAVSGQSNESGFHWLINEKINWRFKIAKKKNKNSVKIP